jgi:hypothetical protein
MDQGPLEDLKGNRPRAKPSQLWYNKVRGKEKEDEEAGIH